MKLSRRLLPVLALSAVALAACGRRPKAGTSAGALASVAVSGGGVAVDVIATESWAGGFKGAIRVTNSSFPRPITSFSVVFRLGGTATIQGRGWDGTISEPDTGGNRTCLSPGWLQYQPILSGTSWDEGFIGAGTFAGSTIVSVTVNGQVIPIGNGSDTTPPTVTIQSDAATVRAPTAITLTATASDDVGVARVDFYDGVTLLESRTAAPYVVSVPVTRADNGPHAYTARAFDAANNSATSAPANVTIDIPPSDTTPPTVFLVSSAVNVTTASTITLAVTAADDVGVARVEFYEGTTLLGTRTSAPYEFPISFTTPGTGTHTYTARAFDAAGNSGTSAAVVVSVQIQEPDLVSPTVALTSSATSVITASTVTLSAAATDDVGVARVEFYEGTTLIGTRTSAPYEVFISFTSADNGAHTYTARAFDAAGNSATSSAVNVTVDIRAPDTVSPTVSLAASATNVTTASTVTLIATASDDVGVARVEFYEGATLLGTRASAPYELAIAFTSADNGVHAYTARAFDVAANSGTSTGMSVTVDIGSGTWVPPDPATVAPPNDPTVATDIADATEFLYTGSNPIQVGVPEGMIEAKRVAVVRGQVRARGGAPIEAVTVSVLGHPEFGSTRTRTDGRFDLAVNGGGLVTIDYQKSGYIPAQRQVHAPWRDYVEADEVVLVPYDAQRTEIQFGAQAMQVARGSRVVDGDGSRQATVLFPAGTQATVTLPDGTTASLDTVHVRATEYTVGDDGPRAMPATLPPTSAYTYAVELSIDEVVAIGATNVQFDRPIPLYVDNFLGFSMGGRVPTGYYDRSKGVWVASDDGRVVKILGVTGGLADLDTDGDARVDDAPKLAAFGVSDAERAWLGAAYAVGASLWRVPLTHFSPWDCNWPFGCDGNCPAPDPTPPTPPDPDPNPDCDSGSIIDCNNQTLGEVVEIAGTPYRMHYSSGKVVGRTAERTTSISLSGASTPANAKSIELMVEVAGQVIRHTFPPLPDQRFEFTWNGLDAYGRPVQGAVDAKITVGWTYRSVYLQPSERSGSRSFAAMSNERGGGGVFLPVPTRDAESQFWRTREWTVTLSAWNAAQAVELGGWTLGVHHSYDVSSGHLLPGNGAARLSMQLGTNIATMAGTGVSAHGGDGGPATQASFDDPAGLALGPDGALFISDWRNARIRRVGPDGIITTVAGNGTRGYGGDGGPATAASLNPAGIALGPDGALFIADGYNHRVRRVGPDGIITTVAGTGAVGYGGDGGPATAATLWDPNDVEVGPDGALFIVEYGNQVVRRVGTDGTIITVAGTGVNGYGGDGGPATAATLGSPVGIGASRGGEIFIVEVSSKIRRVGPDGIITTVAGTRSAGFAGDGAPATAARLANPYGVAVAADGTLYIADTNNNRVRRVGPDGIISTFVGTGKQGVVTEGGAASGTPLTLPREVVVGPDGALYLAGGLDRRVYVVKPRVLHRGEEDIVVASADGREVYVFDGQGRHLETVDAQTQVALYSFAYDDAGRLISVTDRDGLVTRIERVGGVPTAIVAPHGQRTALAMDPHGYLSAITNPAGESRSFTYGATGLMSTYQDPRGGVHAFEHDGLGRLTRDSNPAGGSKELARTLQDDGYTVFVRTALGRTTEHRSTRLSTGGYTSTLTRADGASWIATTYTNGAQTAVASDGTRTGVTWSPDPRFGMRSPLATSAVQTSAGRTLTIVESRTAKLQNPNDPFSATELGSALQVNGRTYSSTYSAQTQATVFRSPVGRNSVAVFDDHGRLTELRPAGQASVFLYYAADGRPQRISQGARSYTFGYDAGGYVQTITDPLGGTVGFSRDPAGRITSQSLPGRRTVTYGYDPNGNVTSLTPPGRPAHAFQYTPADLTASYVPPIVAAVQAVGTSYTYDLDGALTQVFLPDESAIVPTYDFAGRLESVITSRGTSTLGYDPAGRVGTITAPSGTLAYNYDGPLMTSETATGPATGSVGWTYDNDFRVTATIVNGTSVSYQYDADSLLTAAGALGIARDGPTGRIAGTSLGSVTTTHGYNEYGELASVAAGANDSSLYRYTLTRDLAGKIAGKTEIVQGVITSYEYEYDDAGRLQTVRRDGQQVAGYLYDDNGNRLTGTTAAGASSGAYDAQDRLLSYGGATYGYRPSGELSSKTKGGQTTWYDYDPLGNLRGVALPDGRQLEYSVDGRNRRAAKRVGGVLVEGFLYEGQLRPVAWLDGSGQVYARFVYGLHVNVPEYMVTGAGTFRFLTDHLGSVRLVVNTSTGAVAQRIDYDEWGVVLADSNPGFQPFGFAGGLYDRDTGLVRFGARDYDPGVGRWTAKDPIRFGGGLNLYAYVGNDPVNFIDPSGRIVAQVAGAVIGAAFGGVGAYLAGGDASQILEATLVGAGVGLLTSFGIPGFALWESGLVMGSLGGFVGNLGNQYIMWKPTPCDSSFGLDNVDMGSLAISTTLGMAAGAYGGMAGEALSAENAAGVVAGITAGVADAWISVAREPQYDLRQPGAVP